MEKTKIALSPPESPPFYKSLQLPRWAQIPQLEKFINLDVKQDDIFLSSLPKGGTTWVNKILVNMLRVIDDNGVSCTDTENIIGAGRQIYPEGLPATRPEEPHMIFGKWGFSDLVNQPSPRLFSTHLYGHKYLPHQLTAETDGKGKLIVVLRNLKDVCTSLHFFMGEAKDGWLGNEFGPGSFNRFLDGNVAFGSYFDWIADQDKLVQQLRASGRVLVLYFEELKKDLPSNVDKVADFIGVKLTPKKREAVINAATFSSMKKNVTQSTVMLRKGAIGDWKNHLDETTWARLDEKFQPLATLSIAKPLIPYQ